MTTPAEPPLDKSADEVLEHDLTRGAAVVVNCQQVEAAAQIGKGIKDLAGVNRTGQSNAQQAGFRAEIHHEASFNADAVRKGLKIRAERPKGNGPADIHIKQGDQVVAQVQVKNYKTVAGTTKAISAKKYDGMQKVTPSDQVEGVQRLAVKRGVDGLGERNYADTGKSATAQMEQGGGVSRPLSYQEAQSKSLGTRLMAGEATTAARAGAQSGAVIGGAVSTVSNVAAVINGEKTALQATGAVAKDVALAAAAGAASAAATSAVTAGCTRVGLQVLNKGGAPGVVAATGIEVAKDLIALKKGELTAGQAAGRSLEHAGNAGGAWAGAVAGAAIGSVIPGPGTLVGGIIGGMLGSAGARKAIGGLKGLFSSEQ